MFEKRVITKSTIPIHYKFNINDPVLCTIKNEIKDTFILSRYVVNGDNYYKIGNSTNIKTFKESALIHR